MQELQHPRSRQRPSVQATQEEPANLTPANLTLPESRRVVRNGEGWTIQTHTGLTGVSGTAVVVVAILAGAILLSTLVALPDFFLGAGGLSTALLFLTACLPTAMTAGLYAVHRILHTARVTPDGVWHLGRHIRPASIDLTGVPGGRLEISTGHTILFSHLPKWGDAWPYATVRALAEGFATTLDVPLRVLLDEEAWEHRPDAHQSQLKERFETIRRQTLQDHPELSALEPAEPGFLMWRHDGFQTEGLVLTATDIRRSRDVPGIPLADVRDLAIGYDFESGPRLRVLLPHRIETLCGRSDSDAGIQSLLWIEQQIRARMDSPCAPGGHHGDPRRA